jgi:transglutaminase-like putative cysteine protease
VAADVPRQQVPWAVHVLPAFQSRWLPTTSPAGRVTAAGDWRYDTQTMDFMAVPKTLTAAGLDYSFTRLDLSLTAQRLEDAGTSAGQVSRVFTDVPADVPAMVRQLAAQVTRDATTRFDKAVALQDWFRRSGGFTYSLRTQPGSGYEALTSFLQTGPDGRTGYCEQFAASMALMARILGIPSRVAIGFLHPTQTGPQTYVYSARDLHAWPELYFDRLGWVRFEPTPGRGAVPTYAPVPQQSAQASLDPKQHGNAAATVAPTAAASGSNSRHRTDPASVLLPVLRGVGIGAGVVVLLLLPGLMRVLVRRRRFARLKRTGPADVGWREILDTGADLGLPPPDGSPRVMAASLDTHLTAPDARAALGRIRSAFEVQTFGRRSPSVTADDVQAVVDGLRSVVTPAARLRGTVAPVSLLGRLRRPRLALRWTPPGSGALLRVARLGRFRTRRRPANRSRS